MLCLLMSNVCAKDMYLCLCGTSSECCVCLWSVHTYMFLGHCVLMYVYICVDRERGWLLPTTWQLCTEAWRHHHHSAGPSLRYIPRRAVLYCPGNDERKLRKLSSLDVDCAVLDCEDGVALSKKVHEHTPAGVINEMQLRMKGSGKEHTNAHKPSCVWSWMIFNSISLLQTGARS